MKVTFDRSFLKSIERNNVKYLKDGVLGFIELVEEAESLQEFKQIPSVKKLVGYRTFYRYRIGNYRVGMEYEKPDTINFIVIAKRSDVYKKFP